MARLALVSGVNKLIVGAGAPGPRSPWISCLEGAVLRPRTLRKSRHLSVPGLHAAKKLLPLNSPETTVSRGPGGIAPGEPPSAVHARSSLSGGPDCRKAHLLPTALGERDGDGECAGFQGFCSHWRL